jgi:hypothetical protein
MNRVSAPGYDLFKLVVSLILAAILLLMLLRGCAATAAPSITETSAVPNFTATSGELLAPTETVSALPATDTVLPSTSEPTSTEAASTSTPTPTPVSDSSTPTVASDGTPTTAPDATATAAVTETPASEAGATPSSAGESACNTRVPSRLELGQQARVTQRLNMRGEASIAAPILSTNPTGTEVEIIGGPVCTPVGERAYLWWQIRLPDGAEGWSAEMQLNEPSYLLEPIP